MQPFLREFVRDVAAAIECPDPIVEFGSLQVEATQEIDLRDLFAGRAYTGTDFREGAGVDRVEDLRALSYGDDAVGTAICLETLEHCEDPIAAGRELARVTAAGGVCIVSSVMLLGIHGYPEDYFRFTPAGLGAVLSGFANVRTAGVGDPEIPTSVVAVATHERPLDLELHRLPGIAAAQERWERADGTVRLGPLRVPPRDLLGTGVRELARIAAARVRRR